MSTIVLVRKSSGEMVPYSEEKLRRSLERSGASKEQTSTILKEVSLQLYQGISTKKIFKIAFQKLKHVERHVAAKYHLKGAIMDLGPSGFPFEKFVSELFLSQGYKVAINQTVNGKCVQHEIDVVAEKKETRLLIECKYHNLSGVICDVKIPLYIHSRFQDVMYTWQQEPHSELRSYTACIVTNTRFSDDAIAYGRCSNMKLLSWNYPEKGGLKDMIDNGGLYPITCITSLTKAEKKELLARNYVLGKALLKNPMVLSEMRISEARMTTIINETSRLCGELTT